MDPQSQAIVDALAASGRKPYEAMAVDELRATYRAGCALTGLAPVPARVRGAVVATDHGPLALRLYRPEGASDAPLPAILFFHGGGWVFGDLDTHDPICRRLAQAAAACVVAVDYRLSPEHPFPAAVQDAHSALQWLLSAQEPGIDAARLALAGDSAGGNLAAVTGLIARGERPAAIAAQALFYPVTDLANEHPSYARVSPKAPLTGASMRWLSGHYVPDPSDRRDWRASPLLAPSLQGSPSTFIVTCGQDPLADEGRAYARRLEQEGVVVAHLDLPGHVHGLLTNGGRVAIAGPMLDLAAAHIRAAWG